MDGQPRDQASGLTDSASGDDDTEDAGIRALPERRPPRGPGDTLGRYHIEAMLGGGGMGVVYRAYDPDLEREVAVKVLRPVGEGIATEAQRARLVREAQAMAKLSHPNVVAVYEVGTTDDEVFVAMELVEGSDLRGWIDDAPRAWPAVVDVFVQAGRGLAAAHDAGLVHRDFKPHNVLIGDDGRVRVVDFGLARLGQSGSDDEEGGERGSGDSGISDAITRFGDIVGTPAYMAPEQHDGREPDPRSDQFSFCVSLWEAVYGARPFRGRTPAELYQQAAAGPPVPPTGRTVPPRLRRTILRGLQPDPAARFSSIAALTEELRALRTRRRWWAAAAVGVSVSLATTLGLFAAARHTGLLAGAVQEPCTDAAAPLQSVWNDERRDALVDVFVAADPRQGSANAERLEAALGQWASAWTETRTQACRDTRVGGYQTEDTLAERMRCLDRRLGEVDALLGVWTTPSSGATDGALVAFYDLSAPSRCLEGMGDTLPSAPEQPERAERLDTLSPIADRARALRLAGRVDEALALSGPLLDDARALGWPRFTAEVLALHAHILEDTGQIPDATALYAESARAAASVHDTTLAARSLGLLVFHRAVSLSDTEGALAMAPAAEAMAELAGPLEQATVANERGAAQYGQGDYPHAAQSFERAVELRVEGAGADDPRVASILLNVSGTYRELRDEARARGAIERATEIFAAAYPPEHPKNATPLQALGLLELSMDHFDAAIDYESRALAILRAAYGDRNVRVGYSLNNIGSAYLASKRPEQALPSTREAMTILVSLLGPDHADVGKATSLYAEALLDSGNPAEALPHARRAVEIVQAVPGQHRSVADAAYVLTMCLVQTGGDATEIRALTELVETEYAASGGSKFAAQLRATVDAHLRDLRDDPVP